MFTVYEHTIGMPDYLDRDLGKEDDCFLFETQKEAERCSEIMDQARKEDGYRYYTYKLRDTVSQGK